MHGIVKQYPHYIHTSFHFLTVVSFFLQEFVGCPVMENDKVVQQPVDLTTLAENCDNAAVEFIHRASGQYVHTYIRMHGAWLLIY